MTQVSMTGAACREGREGVKSFTGMCQEMRTQKERGDRIRDRTPVPFTGKGASRDSQLYICYPKSLLIPSADQSLPSRLHSDLLFHRPESLEKSTQASRPSLESILFLLKVQSLSSYKDFWSFLRSQLLGYSGIFFPLSHIALLFRLSC